MPYQGNYRGGFRGRNSGGSFRGRSSNASASRVTGLFKTRRPGLYVGTVRDEQFAALIDKIKQAKSDGKGLTFFLWKNDRGDAAFSLSADVEQEQQKRRQSIEDDEGPEPEGEEADDLFGKD